MPPGKRAGAIARLGLTGAPPAAAAVEETDATASADQDATTAERPEVTAPRRQRTTTARRSEAVTPRRREGRPSATAETTIATTVRLSVDESYAQRALLLDMARRARIKQLDRSEVDRVLWRLLADDPQLQDRVLAELG
jgi:hypothetical protein